MCVFKSAWFYFRSAFFDSTRIFDRTQVSERSRSIIKRKMHAKLLVTGAEPLANLKAVLMATKSPCQDRVRFLDGQLIFDCSHNERLTPEIELLISSAA